MSYKPEQSGGYWLTPKAKARARRDAKKATVRIARRAARRDPENAPVRRVVHGYID